MDNNYLLNVIIHMKNHCYTSHVNLNRVSRFDGISSLADAHPTRCYTAVTIGFTDKYRRYKCDMNRKGRI